MCVCKEVRLRKSYKREKKGGVPCPYACYTPKSYRNLTMQLNIESSIPCYYARALFTPPS